MSVKGGIFLNFFMTDIQKHSIEYYGIDRIACAGLSGKHEDKVEVRKWLESMTPEQLEDHYKREKELQEKRKLNHLY